MQCIILCTTYRIARKLANAIMPYLIDGHNLIPKIPGFTLQALDDELELIKLLQDFCRRNRKKVAVNFDNAPAGQQRVQKYGAVTAHFVRTGLTADTAIKRKLASLGRNANNWTVVTSDRAVQSEARAYRATVIPSEQFAQQLSQAGTQVAMDAGENTEVSLSEADIQDWLNTFNEES